MAKPEYDAKKDAAPCHPIRHLAILGCTWPVNARVGDRLKGTRTMTRTTLPSRDEIRPDTPLRLGVAAALAFPDGSMTASGLRRERARGHLMVERIAGKEYTTLAYIERMRELCRVQAKAPGYGSVPSAEEAEASPAPSGSLLTVADTSPRDALRVKLAKRKNG